jgi:ribosomal-protein-alanine N-acetyltransferase
VIRVVGEDAAPILAELHASTFDRPWSGPDIAALLHNPVSIAFLAQDSDGAPLGFILAWAPGADAEILTLAIDPHARRQGHGATLTRAACAIAAARGATAMLLEVAADNAPARALYEKLGFRQHAVRPLYYASGADALILRRDLAPPES